MSPSGGSGGAGGIGANTPAGSILGAAQKLMIAQPALSKSMSNLEDVLGVSLFQRGRKGITLTAAGIIYKGEPR
ncbi:MAG: LysR family transcriptional regulator [Gammaproteobacteria bacterium]|nr:LysR family transcriptional regulator [Gammaproteobacteria bacterium]